METFIEKENIYNKLDEITNFLIPFYGLDKDTVKKKMPEVRFDSDGYALYYHENNLLVITEKPNEDEISEEIAHFLHYQKNPNIFSENKLAIHTFFELVATYAKFIYFKSKGEMCPKPSGMVPGQHIRAYEMTEILFAEHGEKGLEKIAAMSLAQAKEFGKRYDWDLRY